MKKRIAAIVAIYIAMFLVTYPALLADIQHDIDDANLNQEFCRKDVAAAVLFALIPPVWLLTPFVTGFYEHGFQFTCRGISYD